MSGRSTGGTIPVVAIATRATQTGVYGEATSGTGVHGKSATGYGVIVEGDTTTPAKCAFRLVPQDTEPTNALVGDMYVSSAGKLNICTVSHTTTPTFVVVGSQS